VYECNIKEIKDFVEKWHYSKSINGLSCKHCFKLVYKDKIVGAMIFGRMSMVNQWKKYGNKESEVIELRRLCCIDSTPKNTESFFISKCLKMIKKYNYKIIVSYADPTYNHVGTIYKASNFTYVGRTAKGKLIIYKDKIYHDHAIRTKYKGKLKPFAEKLKKALEENEAKYIKTEGKYIYVYKLGN
jgi:hypothetical protein